MATESRSKESNSIDLGQAIRLDWSAEPDHNEGDDLLAALVQMLVSIELPSPAVFVYTLEQPLSTDHTDQEVNRDVA
jgi:hypothetical protein